MTRAIAGEVAGAAHHVHVHRAVIEEESVAAELAQVVDEEMGTS